MLVLHPEHFTDHVLLDSGNLERLERFGKYLLVRPEPKAVWKPTLPQSEWGKADAFYHRSGTGGGFWKYATRLPQEWTIRWQDLTFKVQPTGFKHVGLFPEHEPTWRWVSEQVKRANGYQPHILNLFGYTGAASLAASAAGARVTHVDGSKEIVTWARENAQLSGLSDKPIRWIVEDALTYARRELKRGVRYDGILVDAPKFGRGAKGEVWKFEEDVQKLLEVCAQLLAPNPLFFVLFSYTTGYSALVLNNMLQQYTAKYKGEMECGELALTQEANDFLLSTTVFARWHSL